MWAAMELEVRFVAGENDSQAGAKGSLLIACKG